MNKIISINISGVIFHIEENAYQTLQNYLNAIHNHFYNSKENEEIVKDIEARIAEIFQAKINDKKQVITLLDVEEMIKIMGKPEEFGNNEDTEQESESYSDNYKKYYPFNRKRLFRDGDNRILGGVCSGLGHAFSIDPVIFRIIFVIIFLFMGFGVLLYVILWIIIPKAITASEKLEMKREPINISNIEKNINDEFDELKNKYKSHRYRNRNYWRANNHEWIKRSFDVTGSLVYYLFRTLAILLGGILLFISFGLLILLIVVLTRNFDANMVLPGGFISVPSISQFLEVLYSNSFDSTLAIISLFILVGIPLVMLIFGAFKLIFRINANTRFISATLGSLWFLGLLTTIYCIFIAFTGFKETGVSSNYMDLNTQTNRVLYIQVNRDTLLDNNMFLHKRHKHNRGNIHVRIDGEDIYTSRKRYDWKKIIFNNDIALLSSPNLVIDKSQNDNFEVKIIRIASGENKKGAIHTASKINYNITNQDTSLIFQRHEMEKAGSYYTC